MTIRLITNQVSFAASCALLSACFVMLCPDASVGQEPAATDAAATYSAAISEGPMPAAPAVQLPSLEAFTGDAVAAKLPAEFSGSATITSTAGIACLSESFKDSKRSKTFQAMQGREETQLIKLTGGALTLAEVVKQVADSQIIETMGDETILRLPILVADDATLVIRGEETPKVRLVTKTGTLLANAGKLFIIDATVSSWDETTKAPTAFADASQFRPFITSFTASQTYLAGSTFQHLGYGSPSAYGLTLTSHPRRNTVESVGNWPTGTLVKNTFEGLYYGFYSFEARDVAIVENHYKGSIRYGIDPHDRSTRLVIAKNIAEGTIERHGIIGSRGISDSFIFDNVSKNNTQSGIMLDRQCSGNVIVNNRVFDNGNGIALYESSNNRLLNNIVAFNAGTGIRCRNSTDILVQDNKIVGNEKFAVSCEGRHLSDHEKRMARGDTYETIAGVTCLTNVIAGNGDGQFKGQNMSYLRVGGIQKQVDLETLAADIGGNKRRLPETDNDPLGGELEAYEIEFQAVTRSAEKLLEITRTH